MSKIKVQIVSKSKSYWRKKWEWHEFIISCFLGLQGFINQIISRTFQYDNKVNTEVRFKLKLLIYISYTIFHAHCTRILYTYSYWVYSSLQYSVLSWFMCIALQCIAVYAIHCILHTTYPKGGNTGIFCLYCAILCIQWDYSAQLHIVTLMYTYAYIYALYLYTGTYAQYSIRIGYILLQYLDNSNSTYCTFVHFICASAVLCTDI